MDNKTKRVAHNKLSWEQVKQSFLEVHGEGVYGYSEVEYVDTHTPIKVFCEKHKYYFYPTPKNHKNGSKCYHCGRESQIEKAKKEEGEFINELTSIHGNIFDLSRLNYINSKTDVELGCSPHGFFKRKPEDLLLGRGCKKCRSEKSKYNNRDPFIEENKKKFGDITDFCLVGDISKNTNVDLICTVHNHKFTLSVSARLNGQKCPKCSAENYRKIRAMPTEEYYKKASEVHDNKYTYTGDYETLGVAITFYCDEHGRQRRNANNHLKGAGCSKCEKTGNKVDKLTKEGYVNTAKGRVTSLYLIECWNEEEKFYKIGKTFRGVKARFSGKLIPYQYKILSLYESSAEEIWDLEELLHIKYKEHSYKSNKWFVGFSECYNLELPVDEIIKLNSK